MYDSVDCRFFGDENFYGFEVSYEGKKGWEYDKPYFYDVVIDFLNKDYFALCGGWIFKAKNYPYDDDNPRMGATRSDVRNQRKSVGVTVTNCYRTNNLIAEMRE